MTARKTETPLFVTESNLAKLIMGSSHRDWAPIAKALERDGFPLIDPLMGGRYWRAVVAFFDARHGLGDAPVIQPSVPFQERLARLDGLAGPLKKRRVTDEPQVSPKDALLQKVRTRRANRAKQ